MKPKTIKNRIVTITASIITILLLAFCVGSQIITEHTYIRHKDAVYSYLEEKGIALGDQDRIVLPYRLLDTSNLDNIDETCLDTSYAIVTKEEIQTFEVCSNLGTIKLYGNSEITLEVGTSYVEEGAYIDGSSKKEIKVSSTVNTSQVGTYVVNYYVEDQSVSPALRIVHIVDTEKPIVTLNGSRTVYINQNDTYQDLGATATDNYDSNIEVTVDASAVNTSELGTYEVLYRALDQSGNETIVKRTVVVREKFPTILLEGTDTVYLDYQQPYVELGYEAYNYDRTNLTKDVTTVGSVDSNRLGTYQIHYTVTNLEGTKVTVTRTVIVRDKTAPQLTLLGDKVITLEWGTPYVEPGVTAVDNVDGNITSEVVKSGILSLDQLGTYYLVYTATDSSSNKVSVTRTIKVVDTIKPVLTLNGNETVYLNAGRNFIEPGFTATDNHDGNLSSDVIVDYNVIDRDTFGSYTLTYTVTDASSNTTTVTRTVVVEDKEAPVITLKGANTIYVEYGTTYRELGASVTDNYDETKDITGIIYNEDNEVVTECSEIGTYYVKYNATDTSSNQAQEVIRTVIVRDTLKPIISLEKESSTGYQKEADISIFVADKNSPIKAVKYAITNSSQTPKASAYQTFENYNISQNTLHIEGLTGVYYVHAIAVDIHNNQSLPVTLGPIYFDNTKPNIQITPNGLQGGIIETTLNATDSDSGIKQLLCTWSDQKEQSPTSYQNCTNGIIEKLGFGSFYLWIKATDAIGNETTFVSEQFLVEKAKPTISFDNQGTVVKIPSSIVHIKAYDGKTIKLLEYAWTKVGEEPSYETYFGNVTDSITFIGNHLTDGTYQLWIKATDSENKTSITASNTFQVDTMLPKITITAPTVPTKSATITVDIEDTTLKEVYHIVSTSSSLTLEDFQSSHLWSNYTTSKTMQITSVTGTYYVHILAIDEAGNKTYQVSNPIILDNEIPLAPTIHSNITSWTKENIEVTMTSKEGTIYYRTNNGMWEAYKHPLIITQNHTTISARVMDQAGNYSDIATLEVNNIDQIAPSIVLDYDMLWTNNMKINYHVMDNDSKLKMISYGFSNDVTQEPSTWETLNLDQIEEKEGMIQKNDQDGTYYLWMKAIDCANNESVKVVGPFILDKTLPTVSFRPLASNYPQTSFQTELLIEEENIERILYTFSTSETLPKEGFTSFNNYDKENNNTITLSHNNTGIYYLYVIVTDKAGNETIAKTPYAYQLVSSKPTVELSIDQQLEYSKTINIFMNVVNEDFITTEKMEYVLLDINQDIETYTGPWVTFNQTANIQIENETGSYNLYVRITDNVDQSRVTMIQKGIYNIDNEKPNVTIKPNGTVNFVNRAYATIAANDTTSGIKYLGYAWTTSKVAPNDSSYLATTNQSQVSSPIETNLTGYYLWVKAIDQAGNITTTVSEPFYVDNSYPEITFDTTHSNISQSFDIKVQMTAKDHKTIKEVFYAWTNKADLLPAEDASWKQLGTYNNESLTHHFTNEENMVDQAYYLQIKVVDSNDYVTIMTSKEYILDRKTPMLEITPDTSPLPSNNIRPVIKVNDVNDYQVYYEWSTSETATNYTEWTNFRGTGSDTLPLIATQDGIYYLHIKVIDKAGNETTGSKSYLLDRHAPEITITGNTHVTVQAGDPYIELGYQVFDTIDGEVEVISKWSKPFNSQQLGTYVITYTATDRAGNTSAVTRTVEVIDTKAPQISLIGDSEIHLIYGTSYIEQGATAKDNLDGDLTSHIIISGKVENKVGDYSITYQVTDQNGNTATMTRTIHVTKRQVIITVDNQNSIYGNPLKDLTYQITEGSVLEGDNLNIVLTKAFGLAANSYTITGTYTNDNYDVTFVDGTYTISKRAVEITIDDKTSMYGEPLKDLTSQITGGTLVGNDNLNIVLTKAAGFAVDTYTITGSYTNDNYNVTFVDGTYTISKRAVEITIDDKTSMYGDMLKELTYQVTEGTVLENDNLNIVLTKAEGLTVNTYTINGAYSNDNYDVTFVDGTYTITARPIEITIDDKTSIYGESLKDLTYQITNGTLIGSDNLNIVLTKVEGLTVNTYTITGSYTNDNYNVTFVNGTYTISKRAVEIIVDDKTSIYGDALKPLTYQITEGTILDGDDLNIILTKADGLTTNTYAITGTYTNDNYDVTFVDGIYTISKRVVEITIDDKTSIYGESLKDLTYRTTTGDIVEGDNLNIVLTKATGFAVNTYAITGTHTNDNYDVTFVDGTYTIMPRLVEITIDDKSSMYGESLKDLTYQITEGTILDGDDLNIILTKADGLTTNTYAITGTYTNANYNVTFIDGTYTITARPVEITIDDKTSIYVNELETLTYQITTGSVLENDNLNIVLTKVDGLTVDTYAITGTYTNDNYNVTFVNGTYTITARPIEITIDDKSSIYGESLKDLTYQITEGTIVNSDDLNIILTKSNGLTVNTYTINGAYSNDNYNVTFVDGTYTITPRPIEITIDDKTSIYGESLKDLTYQITSGTFVGSDDLNITLTKAAGFAVDTYAITGTHENDNYDITFVNGIYTITPRLIEITIDDKSSMYGELLEGLTYQVTTGNIIDKDNLNIVLTKVEGLTVDIYAITGTYTNDNYDVTFVDGIYTITKRIIEVTIDNKTSIYGEPFQDLTYQITNGTLVNSDNLNITLTKADGLIVDTYTITGTYTNDNYDVTFVDGTYAITPRPIEITIDDKTSIYGESLKDLTYQITSGTLVGSDDLNIILTKAEGSTVDIYAITGTYTNANYNVTFVDGTYTVTARPIEIKIDDKSSIYGESLKDLTYQITEGTVLAGDDLNVMLEKETGLTVKAYNITGTHSNNNYDVTFVTGIYTITKRMIEITIDDKTSMYGNPFETLTYRITNGTLIENDDLNISLRKENGNTVGTYTIIGTYANDNYDVTFIDGTYRITKRIVKITIDDKTSMYGEPFEELTYHITSGSMIDGDNVAIVLNKEEGTIVDTYRITGTYMNNNYDIEFVDGTYTITKRVVEVTINNQSSIYGNKLVPLTYQVTNSTVMENDDLNIVLTKAEGLTVDTYAITGSYANENYDVTFIDGIYTITARPIEITIDDKASVYGESFQDLTYQITSGTLVGSDDLSVVLTKADGLTANTYDITGSYANENYDVTFINGVYTIAARPIEITIDNKTSVYGESFQDLTYQITSGMLVGSDDLNIVLTKAEGLTVDTYAITGSHTNDNYDVTFVDGSYTITARPIEITIDNKTGVYGDALKPLTYQITEGTVLDGDDLNIILTKTDGLTVNTYDITGAYANDNYDVTFVNGTYSITKRVIEITIDDKTSIYGDPIKDLTYSINDNGLVNDDNLNITLTKEDGQNIGDYIIAGTYANDNYEATFIEGTYSITKRMIEITVDDKTSIYGNELVPLTYQVTTGNVVEGDHLSVVLTKAEGLTVDTYAITGTYTNDNYDVTFVDGIYTITARPIEITIDDKTSIYGELLQDLTYQITEGMVLDGDDLSVVLAKAEGLTVDTYAITGTYTNDNYSVTFVDGSYTITARPIEITIDNKTSIYGDALKPLTYQITSGNLVGNDDLNVTLTKELGNNVGKYTVTGSYSNDNYDITFVNGIYSITKRIVEITVDDKTSIYGNELVPLTYQVTTGNVVEGDHLNVVLTKAEGLTVDTYAITGTYTNDNYDATFIAGTYTITKRTIEITIDDKTSMYGNAIELLTYQVTNGTVLAGDDLNVILTKELGSGVETYTITGTYANENYDVTFIAGTYSITKRTIEITIDNKTSVYGEALQALTYQVTSGSIIAEDNLNIVLTKEEGFTVNTYDITGAYANDNYDVTFINGVYTISKAIPDYVVPDNLTAEYGSTLASVKLPKGFTFEDPLTTSVGDLGPCTWKLTYTPEDTDNYHIVNHIGIVIDVLDHEKPTITIIGDQEITLEVKSSYMDAGATAKDNHDGDITSKIEVTNNVNVNKVGTYTVVYTVRDISGNEASMTRTIHIVDTTKPILTLKGDSLITMEYGYPYYDLGAIATDNYDGDITSKIKVTSNVNVDKLGTYTVIYSVMDTNGNAAFSITRTVKVTEANLNNKIMNSYHCTGSECYASATAENNYLWYSGQLWRIIKVDSNGNILMVTDQSLTSMPYGYMSSIYTDSYAKAWLNNHFYQTLDNPSNVLNTSQSWCNESTQDASSRRKTCSTLASSAVGMLTLDEYNLVGGKDSYLNNGSTFFTMTPSGTSHNYAIKSTGEVTYGYYVYYTAGIRATVSLRENSIVNSGNGTINNPYRLVTEKKVTTNSTIKDRLPGEYVSFAGQLWRIVSQDKDGTKLLMDTYYQENGTKYVTVYGPNNLNINDGIGKYLNTTVYDNLFVRQSDRNKLVSTRWYSNAHNNGVNPLQYVDTPSNYYMDAKVGLISIGELGAVANNNFPTNINFWTANQLINGRPWYISSASTGELGYATDVRTIRPAIKIYANTQIASGSGTITQPITFMD